MSDLVIRETCPFCASYRETSPNGTLEWLPPIPHFPDCGKAQIAARERDEIALRFAVAMASFDNDFPVDTSATLGYAYADAFLAERAKQAKP